MRTRTNMNGLAYHAKPSGKGHQGAQDKCKQAIKRLQKLLDEGYKLSEIKKKDEKPKPTHVVTIVWGKKVKVTVEVFKKRYEPLGFKIVAEF